MTRKALACALPGLCSGHTDTNSSGRQPNQPGQHPQSERLKHFHERTTRRPRGPPQTALSHHLGLRLHTNCCPFWGLHAAASHRKETLDDAPDIDQLTTEKAALPPGQLRGNKDDPF